MGDIIQPKRKYSITPLLKAAIPGLPYSFTLYAPRPLLEYIKTLACILSPASDFGSGCHFDINPLYDETEAYQFVVEQIGIQSQNVELSDVWDSAEE